MNKAELVAAIAAKTGESKKSSEALVNAFTEVVADALKGGDKVQLVGFGSFEVRKRAARKGRNPVNALTNASVAFFESPVFAAIAATNSALFIIHYLL